jgi:hypothetical protein
MYKIGDRVVRTKVNPNYNIPLGTVAKIIEIRGNKTYMVNIESNVPGHLTEKISWWETFFSPYEPEIKWEV